MADLKDLSGLGEHGQRAAVAAGKDMARRALEDLTLSPEEKQQRDEERAAARKKTMIKLGVVGVVGVVAVLSLMSLLAKLWMYAIGALVVLGVAGGGYLLVKPKVVALRAKATARLQAKSLEREAADRERAVVDAAAAKQKKLDDDLAALRRAVSDPKGR